jgi:hypothetical protein
MLRRSVKQRNLYRARSHLNNFLLAIFPRDPLPAEKWPAEKLTSDMPLNMMRQISEVTFVIPQ